MLIKCLQDSLIKKRTFNTIKYLFNEINKNNLPKNPALLQLKKICYGISSKLNFEDRKVLLKSIKGEKKNDL